MKTNNYLTLIAFCFFISHGLVGQPYFSKNYDYNKSQNTGWKIIELNNFFYGLSLRSCSHPYGDCTLVHKFDRNGFFDLVS
ncbi:MAG: hypothetical protein IPH96_14345 [Saprospiraceae bacterium]|nr:hypothetical protein [Saprospiraceae bacterium]